MDNRSKIFKKNKVRIWKIKIHENSYFFTTAHYIFVQQNNFGHFIAIF